MNSVTMGVNNRITETELFKPALRILAKYPYGITTTKLIKELCMCMKPMGEDLFILRNRNDFKFTQKVRNLISHRYTKKSIIRNGYVMYMPSKPSGILKITDKGLNFLSS